ncbi:MAG: single-stranded-DNA-specific exonuclease RecJ [Candidatus Stahlbacteria bacterium]|nr:single-stranded-DNA-specific exonuclease RecJ [Candidatus Stahlbacteria bacterium]
MKKNWTLLPLPSKEKAEKMAQELGIASITANILINRGLTTPQEIYKFLNPVTEDLHDPFLLPQMEAAVTRIIQAIKEQQKILIYGDYDVDGTTASALLYRVLKNLNITPEIYIPNRIKEGYGLTEKGIEYCLKSYVKLIITVDCGTTAVEEIGLLQKNGVDVIVTDHHNPYEELPKAIAIINPKISLYPFKELSGCGVVFKLAQALYKKLGMETDKLLNYLDLVALATVCDVTPLIEENRVFAKYGMKAIEQTKNVGLKALIEVSGLKNMPINPYYLGFVLGPKINAQGRLGEAKEVAYFLTTENRGEAYEIAKKFDTENRKRQAIQEIILKEAIQEIEKFELNKKNGIVIAREGWHPGVIGIVASKIQEKFFRPTLLIAIDGKIGKGSARSIPTFSIYNALSQCKEYLNTYGGHEAAAGFTIPIENIQAFKEKFETQIVAQLKYEELIHNFQIDGEIEIKEIDDNLVYEVERLSPFGKGNPRPVFLTKNAQVVGTPSVVKKEHLKFRVRDGGQKSIKAIGFGLGKVALATGNLINLIYEIEEENYLGKTNLFLKVNDIEAINT